MDREPDQSATASAPVDKAGRPGRTATATTVETGRDATGSETVPNCWADSSRQTATTVERALDVRTASAEPVPRKSAGSQSQSATTVGQPWTGTTATTAENSWMDEMADGSRHWSECRRRSSATAVEEKAADRDEIANSRRPTATASGVVGPNESERRG